MKRQKPYRSGLYLKALPFELVFTPHTEYIGRMEVKAIYHNYWSKLLANWIKDLRAIIKLMSDVFVSLCMSFPIICVLVQ